MIFIVVKTASNKLAVYKTKFLWKRTAKRLHLIVTFRVDRSYRFIVCSYDLFIGRVLVNVSSKASQNLASAMYHSSPPLDTWVFRNGPDDLLVVVPGWRVRRVRGSRCHAFLGGRRPDGRVGGDDWSAPARAMNPFRPDRRARARAHKHTSSSENPVVRCFWCTINLKKFDTAFATEVRTMGPVPSTDSVAPGRQRGQPRTTTAITTVRSLSRGSPPRIVFGRPQTSRWIDGTPAAHH